MGGVIAKIVFKNGNDKLDLDKYESLNEIKCVTLKGEEVTIGNVVDGKKLYLVVNVASK
jgi:hypothetical protein